MDNSTKMGADSSAENITPNAPRFICPRPTVWDFDEKKASMSVRSPCVVSAKAFQQKVIFAFM